MSEEARCDGISIVKHVKSLIMRNTPSLALVLLLGYSSTLCLAQESSSQVTRSAQSIEAPRPTPSPKPEVHKRRSIPEVDDAMAKGQHRLFKKHDARASPDEF